MRMKHSAFYIPNSKFFIGLTEAGKAILHGIGFVALAALVFPAFGVLSVLVWVVLAALAAGFVLRPRIRLSGDLPDRVMAGQTVRLTYVLENVGRFAAYNLWLKFDALPDAIEQLEDGQVISCLGPGETIEIAVSIRPRRRGHYLIRPPACVSSFPFNLFTFGTSQTQRSGPWPIIVLPTFSRMRISTRGPSRQAPSGSTRLTGRMGFSPEYAGNRPFLPGDSPRQIDSRAWARRSVPATKEYHDDFDNRAALILDTAVPDYVAGRVAGILPAIRGRDALESLEAAVCLCASVAFSINDACLIDLLVAGPELHQFTDRPRTVRLDKIQEVLAGVEPSAGYSLEEIESAVTTQLYGISDVFFVVLRWTDTYEALLEAASRAGCRSVVLLVSNAGPSAAGVAGSLRADLEQDVINRASDVQVISPDQILTGQIQSV